MKKIAIIAPGHGDYDERVGRTVKIALKFGKVLFLYDLSRKIKKEGNENKKYIWWKKNVISKEFPKKKYGVIFSRFYRIQNVCKIIKNYKPEIVHIHESGTFGLQILNALKKLNINSKFIWDYHDWIPYEIQGYMNNKTIGKKINFCIEKICKHYAQDIDVTICISKEQAYYCEKNLDIKNTKIIPYQNK